MQVSRRNLGNIKISMMFSAQRLVERIGRELKKDEIWGFILENNICGLLVYDDNGRRRDSDFAEYLFDFYLKLDEYVPIEGEGLSGHSDDFTIRSGRNLLWFLRGQMYASGETDMDYVDGWIERWREERRAES